MPALLETQFSCSPCASLSLARNGIRQPARVVKKESQSDLQSFHSAILSKDVLDVGNLHFPTSATLPHHPTQPSLLLLSRPPEITPIYKSQIGRGRGGGESKRGWKEPLMSKLRRRHPHPLLPTAAAPPSLSFWICMQ